MSSFRALLFGREQLPEQYRRINWIQSDRGQYLDIGMVETSGIHRVDVDMLLPTSTNQATTMFGIRSDSPSVRRFGNMYFNSGLTHGLWIGTSTGVLSQTHIMGERFRYSMEVDEPNRQVTTDFNGLVRTATFNGVTITGLPLYLFGANLNGNITERGTFRLFGFKAYTDNILVRDLVPVIDDENTPLMFDLVNQITYSNEGLSQFTWG